MPASHSNGPPTCTLRHLASSALPNGSDTLLGLPWISGPRSYLAWSFKWVLRYSPSETKIQTPVCASCAKSLGQSCQIGIRASEWTNHKWKTEYCENASRLRAFVPGTSARPVGMGLPRVAWVKLNRLRTGVGRFHSSMHKWGLAPSPNCECGVSEQTADHVLTVCPIHRAPHGARGLTVLDEETRCGLITSLPASDPSSAAVWGSKRINPRPHSCLRLAWSGCPSNDDNVIQNIFYIDGLFTC